MRLVNAGAIALALVLVSCGDDPTAADANSEEPGGTTPESADSSPTDRVGASFDEPAEDDGFCSPSELEVVPVDQTLRVDVPADDLVEPDEVIVRFEIRNATTVPCAWPLDYELVTFDEDDDVVQRVGVSGDCDADCGDLDPGEATVVRLPWVPITVGPIRPDDPPEVDSLQPTTYRVALSLPEIEGDPSKGRGPDQFVPQRYADVQIEVG